MDGLVVANIQDLRAFQQHVCQHQHHQIQFFLLGVAAHELQELLLPLQHTKAVHAGDLGHRQRVACDEELLVIGKQQIFGGSALHGSGEHLPSQLLQRNIGDPRHALGGADVPFGAGGGLEHDGIGQNRRRHHAGHIGRGHQTPVLEHGRDDGIGRANRLVANVNGASGLDVRKAVVIDDLQNFRLLQTGNGLGSLVVVDQHHPLAPGAQQMIPGQHAHHLVIAVQNGVAGMAVLQNRLLHIVHPVVQVNTHHTGGAADASDGRGLEDQPCRPVGIVRGSDDAGLRRKLPQFPGQFCLTQHQTAHIHLQGSSDHLRLVAADHHGFMVLEQQFLPALGQGDDDLAAHGIHLLSGLIEELALQHGEDVEQGNVLQSTGGDIGHMIIGHIRPGKHTVERAILLGYRQGSEIGMLLQLVPSQTHRHGSTQYRRRVKFQIANLGIHIVDAFGRLETEPLQHDLGLLGGIAEAGCLIFPVAAGISQRGIGHGGHNGIGVRISVSGDINGIHKNASLE